MVQLFHHEETSVHSFEREQLHCLPVVYQMLSITAEPTSLQATEMKKKNCSQRALEQSKVMFTQAQHRLQATLLKIAFLKTYANSQGAVPILWGISCVFRGAGDEKMPAKRQLS